ncbi:MAG: hypothetical protein RLY99_1160 [Pseudomonadota bacterium]
MKVFMPQKTHLLKLVHMLMAAVIFAWVNTSFAQADVPESKNYQGIQYITGGIGSEESEAMLELGKKWPLVLEFSQAHPQRPLWVADVTVKIIDQKKKVVFDAMSDGPILLVNLAPGNYELQLSFEGKPLKRAVKIEENKPIKLSITWPI